jgi:PqqD family protein of HPr-rel-A system
MASKETPMRLARHLSDLALSESGFVFDPRSGATFTVNPTGRLVIEALREGRSRDEIAGRLHERFGVPDGAEPGRDVDDFLRLLAQQGLVPADDAGDQ